MSFLFENAATRESLKLAFDKLFAKYDREFDDDDEIDLSNMSVVKVGGHVMKEKKRGFGTCYKNHRRPDSSSRAELGTDSIMEEMLDDSDQPDVYDDVFVKLTGKVKEAQLKRVPFSPMNKKVVKRKRGRPSMTSQLRNLVMFSESDNSDVEKEMNDKVTEVAETTELFDIFLRRLIMEEGHQDPLHDHMGSICKCHSTSCFDCHLQRICLL